MPSGDNQLSGGIYCRKCGYDLRAQTAPHRCPECGRPFDPADRKTFLIRPPRGVMWRWTKRVAIMLLSLGLVLAMCWGWLYRDWKNEQMAKAKTRAWVLKVEPLGGEKLKEKLSDYLGLAQWVLDRVKIVMLEERSTDADLIYLDEFKRLQGLRLDRTQITDTGLVHLKELTGLQRLDLNGTQVTDTGLVHLKELKALQGLYLYDTKVTDAGLLHFEQLNGLQDLDLGRTRVGDAGLVHLKGLKHLRKLDLFSTEVSDAGLVHLKELKGLKQLTLWTTNVTPAGVEKLRTALPGTKIVFE
jgi:hypothetical protein